VVQEQYQDSVAFIKDGILQTSPATPDEGGGTFGLTQEYVEATSSIDLNRDLFPVVFGVFTGILTLGMAQASAGVAGAGNVSGLPEPVLTAAAQGLPETAVVGAQALAPVTAQVAAAPVLQVAVPQAASLISAPTFSAVVAGAGVVKELTEKKEEVSFLTDLIQEASAIVSNVQDSPLLPLIAPQATTPTNTQQAANAMVTNPGYPSFIPNQNTTSGSAQYISDSIYKQAYAGEKFADVATQPGSTMTFDKTLLIGAAIIAAIFFMKKR